MSVYIIALIVRHEHRHRPMSKILQPPLQTILMSTVQSNRLKLSLQENPLDCAAVRHAEKLLCCHLAGENLAALGVSYTV